MALTAVYYTHTHMPNAHTGYETPQVLSSSLNNLIEELITGTRTHNHYNHGSAHQGLGNLGYNPPCDDYIDNQNRFSTLPQNTTYTEYVISNDFYYAGTQRLIISNNPQIIINYEIVSPAVYFTQDHYDSYHRVYITQIPITKYLDNSTVKEKTDLYGTTHKHTFFK